MEPQPKSRGFFGKGNKYGKGRPFGSRNKPKDYPFMKDGSTMVSAQRFRTLASRMAFDLGGRENLTEAQQQLIRRCAMISAQCELMEQETVGGKPLNAIAYGTLTGHLTRTLNALGLKREPIDVTPVLHEYLSTLPADELQISSQSRTRVRADGPACVFCSALRVHLWGTPRSEHFLRPLWVDIEVGER